MPSFLPDGSAAIDSQSSGLVHLDQAAQYGLSNPGKVNVHVARQPHSHTSNESFDESSYNSSNSSQTSEASADPRTRLNHDVNGEYPKKAPPSMNTLPNGSSAGGLTNGLGNTTIDSTSRKPLPNGNSTVLVDRTLKANGRGNDSTTSSPQEAFPRISVSSGLDGNGTAQADPYARPISKGGIRTVQDNNESSVATLPVNASTATSDSLSPEPKNQKAPHRYSSPPFPGPTASGPLAPPPPPAPGIKHRHTLEVPKVTQGRGSRDGAEGYASGRFSPTIGGGVRRASLSLARRNTRSLHSEAHHEVMPDEDAMRWAEAYRQKRATKRRRREIEDDDRVLVGTKVDETHANWVTAYNMLTGIRVAVSRTNAKLDRQLTDADFDVKQKSTFDIAGNELVPSAKYDFKFKDYAPWVFRHLRALFRLDPADYLMSLTGKYILSELGSPGKSGSFFYFSRDYKYIIKTIHHAEHKFLRKILKDYYQHVTNNPNTLLSQFYGLHRVKMPYGKKIHFVVMNNLFPPHRDIHQTFDLKGSTIGRDYREEELANNPRATLKDLNWLRRKRHLELGIQKKKMFLEQLQKDVRLLQKLHIMDYSLLIGIHDLQRGNEENLRDKTLRVFNPGGNGVPEDENPHSVLMRTPSKLENQRKARELRQMIQTEKPVPMGETSSRMPDELEDGQKSGFVFNQDDGGFRATHEDNAPGDEIYYLGVIDCLTHYGMIKKIEHFWKGLSSDRTQISALPPHEYGERFINFINGVTMSQEEALREAQERDAAQAAAAASEERQRVGSWNSLRGRSSNAAPPVPSYLPPAPPGASSSGMKSPEVELTMQKAEEQARRSEHCGPSEENIPDRTLRTTASPSNNPGSSSGKHQSPPLGDRRDTAVLPVVEEAAESQSTKSRRSQKSHTSRLSQEDDHRPPTPAKDGDDFRTGTFTSHLMGGRSRGSDSGRPPPTPPKTGHGYGGVSHHTMMKPDSVDSGYGQGGGLRSVSGSQKSRLDQGHVKNQISRDSLDKALPPLPRVNGSS
ncbi:uncharacterized protein PODANS_5_9630 [Podospora anserina S mat+]|uniref:1-phosphatidylinositol-4-phosphate 5-kinase n=1 Tax=Podospora anserina (strain S / ATCC MYA-4624 / DSM 980 / FGSC 10383) TaxID=515849 RepID=B2AL15_PODAN|nr:uncharacterized protein PODANS_5_9630 [Podospora anserina S mat+]CAP64688.1 unnamed protein product [Podospora anserina S mat+]CDP30083.1 Putative phosphatidylinositol-4-phosphate 5-kinase [Podospora anserina S mat+]